MKTFQTLLMYPCLVGAFALTVWCVVLVWRRQIALFATQLFDKWRRLGNFGRVLLVTFVSAMIVYGSTKSNLVDNTGGTTTNPPPMMLSVPRPPALQVPMPELPPSAVLALNWWLRGGWEDWLTVWFDADWYFPHGAGHLPKVTVMSQGSLRTRLNDTNEIATFGVPLAMVPFETVFTHEHTPSNSYVFTWLNACANRDTNALVNAKIELFRNGDKCITTNGVSTLVPRVLPFPCPGIGQGEDWVRTNFENSAEILAMVYANWVDAQVGYGEDNGLYKLTATVANEPAETFLLTVGEQSVAIAHAGEYVFLLEKGEEYSIDTWPKGMDVEFSARDDVDPYGPFLSSWWNGWSWSEWTTDGGALHLIYPTFTSAGRIWWLPTFYGSPDIGHVGPDSGAMTFTAVLSDYRYAESVAYHWSCEDGNVVIASPNSRETTITFVTMPSWREATLTVTAMVGTNELCSTLTGFTYGTNDTPQVYFRFSAPDAVLLNSNRTDNAKLRKMSLSLSTDAARSGQVRLSCTAGGDRIAIWGTSNKTASVSFPYTWSAENFTGFEAYVEGRETSVALDDVRLKAEYIPDDGDAHEITRDLTVVEIGEVSLPGAPDDGLVVLRGTSVLFEVDCRPEAAEPLVTTLWETRRMKGDGSYDEWAYATANYHGCSAVYSTQTGGVYHLRVKAGIARGGVDERRYLWSDYSGYVYGLCVPGNDKHFGVCDSQWQITLRNNAKGYLGGSGFAKAGSLDSMYGFTSIGRGKDKCNYFVAYMICESGLPLSFQYDIGSVLHRYYPPTANDWANGSSIPNWQYRGQSCYVQPGYVVGHPATRHGHCGIVDFDGWVISAGEYNVNRKYTEWQDGTSGYNTLMETEE